MKAILFTVGSIFIFIIGLTVFIIGQFTGTYPPLRTYTFATSPTEIKGRLTQIAGKKPNLTFTITDITGSPPDQTFYARISIEREQKHYDYHIKYN